MTRVNCGIPPKELSNKHLIAEHREIKRIPNAIKNGKAIIKNIPIEFTLGKGHVKFFYNKLKYLHNRYNKIYKECKNRGFNVTYFGESFTNLPNELYKNYYPTNKDKKIVIERIRKKNNETINALNKFL